MTCLLHVSDQLLADEMSRVGNARRTVVIYNAERSRVEEVTGLLHVSDRLLAGESSRVEAARGTLQALSGILLVFA